MFVRQQYKHNWTNWVFFVCMEMAHICGYNLGILTVLLPSSQYDLPKAAASLAVTDW